MSNKREVEEENVPPKRMRMTSTLTPAVESVKEALSRSEGPVVISLDGNIGAGKSTFLEALREALPDVCCIVEVCFSIACV